jgi:hypothetical protein
MGSSRRWKSSRYPAQLVHWSSTSSRLHLLPNVRTHRPSPLPLWARLGGGSPVAVRLSSYIGLQLHRAFTSFRNRCALRGHPTTSMGPPRWWKSSRYPAQLVHWSSTSSRLHLLSNRCALRGHPTTSMGLRWRWKSSRYPAQLVHWSSTSSRLHLLSKRNLQIKSQQWRRIKDGQLKSALEISARHIPQLFVCSPDLAPPTTRPG